MQVDFGVEKSTYHLLVDGVQVAEGYLPNGEGSSLDLHNLVYLGGDPGGHTKVCVQYHNSPHSRTVVIKLFFFCVPPQGHNVPENSVIGCIRNFKVNEEVLQEPKANHKTQPCFNTMAERGTYFSGGYVVSGSEIFHIPGGCEGVHGSSRLFRSRQNPRRRFPVRVGL